MAGPWHDKPRYPEGEGGFLEVSDWRGTGLPVVQMYRGVKAQVQNNTLACLKEGEVEGLPICSSVLWQWFGLLHTPRL